MSAAIWRCGFVIGGLGEINKGRMNETHGELIRCPKCGTVQGAVVVHTIPFFTYAHTCEHCGYEIMESEWEKIDF